MGSEMIEKYFENLNSINSIGHAFLFSNSDYNDINSCIEGILNKYIFKGNLPLINNPDVYFIEPEKNIIKKELIKQLEENLSTMSQISNNKVYIIKECDKLNDYSANSLLKILEEPSENIYAFLFTKNIERVMLTIKSRCQIIYKPNGSLESINALYNDDEIKKTLSILNKIEDNGAKSIVYNSDLYKNLEKEDLKKVLNILQYFYKDCLNKLNDIELEYFMNEEKNIEKILKSNNENKLINKIVLINKYLNLLNYNLNINSFIDKILIELGRI